MQKIIEEINKLLLLDENKAYPIKQNNDTVFLYKDRGFYFISIPFNDDRNFHEKFVGIELLTDYLNLNDKKIKMLFLKMHSSVDLNKFAHICTEFININNREKLLLNPYKWVDDWREIFGDSKKKYLITDVLSELICLKYIYSKNKTAKWQGPKQGTHDIVFDKGVVEVKSTTKKDSNYIMINSKFQINPAINEEIYLVRLEHKPYAPSSIDNILNELIKLGYDETELENNLKEMGYEKGNRIRKITYDILNINSYKVNEKNFPCITLQDLNSLTKTKNIVNFQLKIDLTTIEYTDVLKNA